MAISKITLNGEVQMDVTQDTVTANNLLSGETATGADGEGVTGNIATKTSSDMTVSGATVTAPAGYYSTAASKSVASGSASTPATTITANPTISVSSAGLITATTSASQNITPAVTAGYVSSGTAGTVSISGSNTQQLTTQAAKTVTPTTSSQTAVAAGVYTTGAVTVGAIQLQEKSATPTTNTQVITYDGDSKQTIASNIYGGTGVYDTSVAEFQLDSACVNKYLSGVSGLSNGDIVRVTMLGNDNGVVAQWYSPGSSPKTQRIYGPIEFVWDGQSHTFTNESGLMDITFTPENVYVKMYPEDDWPATMQGKLNNCNIYRITYGYNGLSQVTVNPIPSQYIIPSGTKTITENGTGIDVASYASVDVNIAIPQPSGVKYIWTDKDGEGAWDVSWYQYCAVDGAPVKDFAHVRHWINLTPTTGLTVKVGYCGSSSYPIYWGDGTSSYGTYSDGATHTYDDYGKYVIESVPTNPDDPYLYFVPRSLDESTPERYSLISPGEVIVYAEISAANRQSGLVFGDGSTTGYLYQYCSNIKKIYLNGICSSGVPGISSYGLCHYASLEELVIGADIQSITTPTPPFADSPNLKILRFLCQVPPVVSTSYGTPYNLGRNLPTDCAIYVPTGTLSAYTSAANYPDPATYTYIEE